MLRFLEELSAKTSYTVGHFRILPVGLTETSFIGNGNLCFFV
jgi:hypothetical protein